MKTTAFNGALLTVAACLFFSGNASASTQTDIIGPAGSEQFGTTVTVLPNGNFVVTDPFYDATGPVADVGRVYLYNGNTLALINTMTGTAANDGVGSNGTANPVTILPNGDYIVCSSGWNGQRGAVTRCNPTTGCPSTINSSNSLVGSVAGDFVGQDGIVLLPNGNFVVRSSQWNNGATTQAGALTWFAAAATPTGNVTTGNSRYGGHSGDQIGLLGVVVLSNSNYVTEDAFWDNGTTTDAGASTFCSGTAACTGVVSSANSLIGTTNGDFFFIVLTPLTNGNYVVNNGSWDNGSAVDVGAATFCNGTTGCHAVVGPGNSLIGTTGTVGSNQGDLVGLNGSIALTNGNYVAVSSSWDSGVSQAGAVTFCSGTAGRVGAVTSGNSLVGSNMTDGVGQFFPGGVYPIANSSDYIVFSPMWTNGGIAQAGAVTYGLGNGGTVGPITVANSVRGMMNGGGGSMKFSVGGATNDLVVGRPPENIVTVFKQGGISFSAVSRKTHGATPFDINLPPAGSPGVECRSGGATNDFRIVFTFPGAVTFNSASVSSGIGSVSSSSGGGTATITVDVTGVANAQTITVTLTDVHSGSVNADISVPMGVLFGDTNGNGTVNATDVSQTKLKTGQSVDATNFRTDVNVSNSISATDVSSVKLKVGTALPQQASFMLEPKPPRGAKR